MIFSLSGFNFNLDIPKDCWNILLKFQIKKVFPYVTWQRFLKKNCKILNEPIRDGLREVMGDMEFPLSWDFLCRILFSPLHNLPYDFFFFLSHIFFFITIAFLVVHPLRLKEKYILDQAAYNLYPNNFCQQILHTKVDNNLLQ